MISWEYVLWMNISLARLKSYKDFLNDSVDSHDGIGGFRLIISQFLFI